MEIITIIATGDEAKITTAMFGVLISSVHIMERVLTLIKIILCIKPAN